MRTSRAVALLPEAIAAVLLTAGCAVPTAPSTPSPSRSASPVGVARPIGAAERPDEVGNVRQHDSDGALAAASAAVSITGEIATAGFITRDDRIASIASARYADELAAVSSRQLDELSVELGQAGITPSQLVWSELPLRERIVSYGDAAAVVEVWSVLVVGVPGHGAPRQVWRTVSLGLVWEREDWRIDAWDAVDGPTPALAAASVVSTVDDVADALAWPAAGRS